MQTIYFKKTVDLNHDLKELQSISVDESIQYKLEENGMRALGNIMIKGEYKIKESVKTFDDFIELDLFADFNKITDKREFQVKVEDFDYSINDGNLNMSIQASVLGVQDDKERTIETKDSVKEIESLIRELDETIEENNNVYETSVTKSVNNKEDEEDLGVYYFYVVKENDTYFSIAGNYKVNEEDLKNYNNNKELTKGTIVIIPYLL